jgi:GcrA cell cycle regulator
LGQASRPRRPRCPSLADLQSPLRSAPALRPTPVQTVLTPPAPPVTTTPIRTPLLGNQPCCWPIGEPGTRSFRSCNVINEAGKPYCPDHCKIAYRKLCDRRDAT